MPKKSKPSGDGERRSPVETVTITPRAGGSVTLGADGAVLSERRQGMTRPATASPDEES